MVQEESQTGVPLARRINTTKKETATASNTMLQQVLTTCVSEESCAVKCAFDFDYEDDEFYVIDEDGSEDEDGIDNDGAYWKIPGQSMPYHHHHQEEEDQEEAEEDIDWNDYDHDTLTTRFSRQTSATLESILGATTSSILSPSSNFIIEDLHLLEQQKHQRQNTGDSVKKRLALVGVQQSPADSKHHVNNANNNGNEPLPLHQNLKSTRRPTPISPNYNTMAPNKHDAITPKQSGATKNTVSIGTTKRSSAWSSLSPKFFSSSSSTRSPPVLPSIIEDHHHHEKNNNDCDGKSKTSTHPSCSTATAMESLTSSEVHYDEFKGGLELTLSGSIVELDYEQDDDDDDDDGDQQSDIIRLDSIIPLSDSPFSCPTSCFFSSSDDNLVFELQRNKRSRMWKRLCSKVAAWKRIALFHLFPHRHRYTRFEI
ncbi:unnamed protein product [Cylindrotheca closterium]|uniref:Uncharacterized protein n=1 Tax=Cylindrotheca closterium TaxID=2856 RepID=A0AAD2G5C4_9STRA|nr:unnamed protein product [Cylindrotheca closterium]